VLENNLDVRNKGTELGRDSRGGGKGSIESKRQNSGANNTLEPEEPHCVNVVAILPTLASDCKCECDRRFFNVELDALSVTGSIDNEVEPYSVEKSRLGTSESCRFDREPVLLLNPSPSNAGTNVLRPSEPRMRKTTSLS